MKASTATSKDGEPRIVVTILYHWYLIFCY